MDTKKILKIKRTLLAFVFVFVFFVSGYRFADAATLQVSPSTATISAGSTATFSVIVNSEGVAVNNAEGTISFPTDTFEIVSISKAGSAFSLWIEEPTYSNTNGTITFNGGVPTPGFNGSFGKVISFVVKGKKNGSGDFVFSSSAVRANDGLGTDILTSKSTGHIDVAIPVPKQNEVVPKVEVKPVAVVNTGSALQMPVIVSSTNPDQEAWYASPTATFNWSIPSTATLIQTAYNKSPDAVPTITYDSSVSQKTLTGLADRVFYFHLRYQDGGKWSPVAHYKFKIDTLAPELFLPVVRTVEGKNYLKLDATDSGSGVDHYSVQIDEGSSVVVNVNELVNNEYVLPVLTQGQHKVYVVAFDKAGNSRDATIVFLNTIAIESPVITVNKKEVLVGETVVIRGQTKYPQTEVLVTTKFANSDIQTYQVTTDASGMFTVQTNKLKVFGITEIFAVNIISDGVTSDASEKVQLKVNDRSIVKFEIHRNWLIALAGIAFVTILLLLIGWIKYLRLKNALKRRDEQRSMGDIYKSTVLLKEELSKQIKVLEKLQADGVLGRDE